MPTPIEVKPLNNYQIWIKYSDGVEGLVRLSKFAGQRTFTLWNNYQEFKQVYVGPNDQISWRDEIDMCPDSMYHEITGEKPQVKGIFNKIIQLYEDQLGLPTNKHCRECDSYKYPLLPWQIGNQYFSSHGGILIAGKPHREEEGKTTGFLRISGVLDGRILGKHLFFSPSKKWPYWSYTSEILQRIFGSPDTGWDHIAFTNIVKCSSSHKADQTSWKCAELCITRNKVIFEEMQILKPRKIVFYTWGMHRDLLDKIPCAKQGSVIEHTNRKYWRWCGKKPLGWWDRSFESIWGHPVDFLILGHPERMKKDEYVKMLADWLKRGSHVLTQNTVRTKP